MTDHTRIGVRRHLRIAALLAAAGAGVALGDPGDLLFSLEGYTGSFGDSTAVNGEDTAIGFPQGNTSGRVHVFGTSDGIIRAILSANDGQLGDAFGASVAINSSVTVVGAPGDDDQGSSSGSVYVFDTFTRAQLMKLHPNDGGTFHYFGNDVALDGQTAVVCAYTDSTTNGSTSGSVYLFDTTTGQQISKIIPVDGASADYFGTDLDIDGSIIAVGAPGDDDNGAGSGSAYLFDISNEQQLFKLLPDDGAPGDAFGTSVAISGDYVVVGAYFDADNGAESGSAYVFDATTGQQLYKLLPPDGAAGDWFGVSVSASGPLVLIGASMTNHAAPHSGKAYLFDLMTGSFLKQFEGPDLHLNGEFGGNVLLTGTRAFISDTNGAEVDVFDTDPNPAITAQPPSFHVVDLGAGPQDFDVAALGFGPLSYQWRLDGAPLEENSVYSGVTTPTLTVVPSLENVGIYDVVVTSFSGTKASDAAVLAVRNKLPSDLNGDGIVDTADLGILLGVFGTTTPVD
ncbi:MAG: FG-GAP repeat protein [Phycisphaeraceae bacterium]|nr:FG-GAP repeat protein [Phycisphaeraceae bacterium]MCB9847766.1 FG-GAP repeat protein [Phycisphaeraceae bacterium]